MSDIRFLDKVCDILGELKKRDMEYSALMDVPSITLTTFPFKDVAAKLDSVQMSIETVLKRYRSINNLDCEEVQVMFKIITICDILHTRLNMLYERLYNLDYIDLTK